MKLARFGDQRTAKGSFRNDANVLAITGIEADYDGGSMTVDAALELLEQQGLASILYTSPSHTEDAPRWRVLCPLSEEMPPARRSPMLGRLNGLFRGTFARESWTLSQSYYYGSVTHNPSHRVEVIDGTPIDQHDDLDEVWVGPPATGAAAADPHASGDARGDAELVRAIVTGDELHTCLVALAARYVGRGMSPATVERLLAGLMLSHPEASRDARWTDRFDNIPVIVGSAAGKFSKPAEDRRALAQMAVQMIHARRRSEEVRAAIGQEAAARGIEPERAESIVCWAAERELQRRRAAHA